MSLPRFARAGSWGAPAPAGLGAAALWGSNRPPSARSFLLQAKLGDEILDYRDLAALPKNKAIYNIDRPDMISYSPYISHSVGDRQSCSEVRPAASPGHRSIRSLLTALWGRSASFTAQISLRAHPLQRLPGLLWPHPFAAGCGPHTEGAGLESAFTGQKAGARRHLGK